MMRFFKFLDWLDGILINIWPPAAYDKDPKTLPMNMEIPQEIPQIPTMTNKDKIYEVAKSLLDTDASPQNLAPSALACAETVNYIVQKATGSPVGGETSTSLMWQALQADSVRWGQIFASEASEGDIVISPTGSVAGAKLAHGHVGIVAKYGILSNNSETGTLEENYDIPSWTAYFTNFGGLQTLFYRCIE